MGGLREPCIHQEGGLTGAIRIFVVLSVLLAGTSLGHAKEFKFSSPGRTIYKTSETFGAALDHNRRRFVMEVALGTGPEGNLGVSLGYLLNRPRGLELYVGLGTRYGPVLHQTLSARYFARFFGAFRPYVGLGYLSQRHTALGLVSHSAYAETGHKWVLRRTYHVTLSLGLQRFLVRELDADSVLHGPENDPDFLARELDAVAPYRLLLALRFSRAF